MQKLEHISFRFCCKSLSMEKTKKKHLCFTFKTTDMILWGSMTGKSFSKEKEDHISFFTLVDKVVYKV